ncbi:MAG: TonB-dependent receptor [Chitinophagaceae bacterium]|nr:TonB-dependent receptor [Chitinophagaceae bacterium]
MNISALFAGQGTVMPGSLVRQLLILNKKSVRWLMRLSFSFILLLCTLNMLFARDARGQDMNRIKLKLEVKHLSLVETLKKVQRRTPFNFAYNSKDLAGIVVNELPVHERSVKEILDTILQSTALQYEQVGNNIVISAKSVTAAPLPGIPADHFNTPGAVQRLDITGTVKNESGAPMAGVSVTVQNTKNGTVTDEHGSFQLTVEEKKVILEFSFVGFESQSREVEDSGPIEIVLKEASGGLNEVVVVGYGTQKKTDVTGSIASINADNLSKIPVSSVTNALIGKLPGLIAIQSSGQPGADASNLNIRGFGNALVIVDGVESNFRSIDASQIENISILKDGAGSIYGARAGNGVILVTTKRGSRGKPTISLNGNLTLQRPTYFQKMLSSGDYTTLVSEEYLQSGKPADAVPYTQEQIQKYYEAKEPGYYNTNWQKMIVRDWAPMQNYNVSLRGGSQNIRYYIFAGTLMQGSFWKKNGGDYKRYNFQTNVDADVLDNLSLGVTVSNIIDNTNSTNRPQNGGGYLFADLYNNKPMYPSSLPDPGKIPFSGSATGGALVQSNRDLGGYTDNHFQTFFQSINANYRFKAIEGLSLKALGNYTRTNYNQKSYGRPVDLWTYNVDTKEYLLAAQFNANTPLNQQKSEVTALTGQLSLNYNGIINQVHRLDAMLLYEAYSLTSDYISAGRSDFTFPTLDQMFAGNANTMSNDGSASETGRSGYVGRINYSYADRYMAQFILRADASAKFPPGSRWGYFPSISLGWRVGQEAFLKTFQNLDELKLRLSYGASGNDAIGNFQYLAGYGPTLMPALFGNLPVMGIAPLGMPNPRLSWEQMSIYNAGVEYSFFNRRLYGNLELFYRERKGIPARKTVSLPSSFGADLPLENLNSQNHRGFEFSIGTTGGRGGWKWDINGNISWQRARWGHVEEIDYTDPDADRINRLSGRWVDRTMGFKTAGLFTSQDQIDNLGIAYPGNPVLKLGDVRYIDTNHDGILDWKDQVEIGKGQIPGWIAGLNLNISYKSFDITGLIQGAFGYYKLVTLSSFTQTYFDNRWTEANNDPNALIARLGGAGTNGLLSDRNFINAAYARLKNFSVGYSLSPAYTKRMKIQQARIYVGCTNMFTISRLNRFDLDPESPFTIQDGQPTTSYYPQQKTIMVGLNITL